MSASGISPSELAFIDNQAPTIALPGGDIGYTENQPKLFLDSSATVVDDDSPNLDTGTLTVSLTANATLTIASRLSIRAADPARLASQRCVERWWCSGRQHRRRRGHHGPRHHVQFHATPAIVQAVSATLPLASRPTIPRRRRGRHGVLTDSDGGTSNVVTFNIGVTPVNDAPVVTTNAGLTLLEGGTAVISEATLEATDRIAQPVNSRTW